MSEKLEFTFTVKDRQVAYLKQMAEKYRMSSESKAMRVLIDYAIKHPDLEQRIFRELHCLDC